MQVSRPLFALSAPILGSISNFAAMAGEGHIDSK
jgi:hypothetical protein